VPKVLKTPWLKSLVDAQLAGVTSKARNKVYSQRG